MVDRKSKDTLTLIAILLAIIGAISFFNGIQAYRSNSVTYAVVLFVLGFLLFGIAYKITK